MGSRLRGNDGSWLLILGLLALVIAGSAHAQSSNATYPTKPIRLINPFPPGGGATIIGRVIAQELTERLGQSVVFDNRGGAGGIIGMEIAARAAPDGYTLTMATASTVTINPLLSRVPFDPIKDFAPVIHVSNVPLILVVHPAVAAKSVKEFITLTKAQPGKINFASSGKGTISHLAGELFKVNTGVNMVHVPYRGGGPALVDVIGGQVQTNFANILSSLPHVKGGRLRGLAVTSAQRSSAIAELPTIAESGIPGYEVVQWNGMLAPARVPAAIVARLNTEVERALQLPEMKTRLAADGADPIGGPPEKFAAFIRADIVKWAKVIKAANVQVD
jgi:tripartite-type tricarboxylate transporter receptor subunit TctC